MTIHIPTWLLWTLGIGLGAPATLITVVVIYLNHERRSGRNPFN